MKIGCGTVIFREYPLRQALELIRSAGYDYVETQATAPFCPHVDVDRDDPLTLRDMVKELPIQRSNYNSFVRGVKNKFLTGNESEP